MYTYEMVALADKDGCTYVSGDMYYSKEKGFHEEDGTTWGVHAFAHNKDGLNIFIHLDDWEKSRTVLHNGRFVRNTWWRV